ncbi:ABC-2 type transport system permease protein [Friedmanniella luteola]|uniref:ABC-2 type transport system permease protein n=1 Tax=Friedmanniella luteola TaxID=546871 RepID=A0A1H1YWQ1_9ACTN|nr:ABC transporter permease [Friedmanniella luteola]SDT25792.1 ABC-2 type transport system permease protein [Friedmanniella luteola]
MSAAEALPATRADRATASPLGWLRFLRSELGIIFGRRRNLAGIGVLAVVPIVLAIAVKVSSPRGGGGPDFVSAITGNGLFVAFAALTLEIPIFLPLAVGVIAGDSVAGEANIGTLRYLLTIPAGRTRLLAVKFAAIVISALVATLVVAAVGTVMGLALFGGGEMTLLSGSQTSMADGLGRLLLTCLYLTVQLSALGAIGLFISTLTEQPIGATVAVVLVNVMMFVLDQISQLAWLHPWLLTHWWTAFGNLLRDPVAGEDITRGLLTAVVYAGVFWLAAWARFSGKDVTS